MRSWRKMTWAIIAWTVLIGAWLASYAGAVGDIETNSAAERTGVAIGAGIGTTFIFMIWFIGFVVLAIIWFMTRPKANVTVYGPAGQQVMVSEKEARRRVARQGWHYQAGSPPHSGTPIPGDFNFANEAERRKGPPG